MMCFCGTLQAEDIIQVIPFKTDAGVVSDQEETNFYIAMNNSSASIWAFQLDIKLPEGMTFDEEFPLDFYMDDDTEESRFPYTKRGKRYVFAHNDPLLSREKDGGWRTIVVSTDDDTRIEGIEGILLKVFYNTAEDMQPGIYPIYVRGTVMTITGTSDIKPVESTSYVIVGNPMVAKYDMACLANYVPSFVMEQLNSDLAANANLAVVRLPGDVTLGAELQLPDNVLGIVGSEATLSREFPAEQWSTVCLPFAVGAEQVGVLKEQGVEVEQLVEFNESTGVVRFEAVDEMEAGRPYIVRCASAMRPFEQIAATSVVEAPVATEAGAMAMTGSFERVGLSSDEQTTYYAFNAQNGQLVRIGSNATILPFRAYMQVAKGAAVRSYSVVHEGGSAAIDGTKALQAPPSALIYDLQGRQCTPASGAIIIKNGRKEIAR